MKHRHTKHTSALARFLLIPCCLLWLCVTAVTVLTHILNDAEESTYAKTSTSKGIGYSQSTTINPNISSFKSVNSRSHNKSIPAGHNSSFIFSGSSNVGGLHLSSSAESHSLGGGVSIPLYTTTSRPTTEPAAANYPIVAIASVNSRAILDAKTTLPQSEVTPPEQEKLMAPARGFDRGGDVGQSHENPIGSTFCLLVFALAYLFYKHTRMKYISRTFVFLTFLLLGQYATAYNANNATVYFDNSKAKWSNVQLLIGKNVGENYSRGHALTHIEGTDLWVLPNVNWDNYSYYMFIDAAGEWGEEYNEPWNRRTYADHYSKTSSLELGSGSYVHKPEANTNEAPWHVDPCPQDYRFVRVKSSKSSNDYYSNVVRLPEDGSASDTVSFFAFSDGTLAQQRFNVGSRIWVDATPSPNVSATNSGVKVAVLQENASDVTINGLADYKGLYYIRTDCADGGWNNYKTYSDNIMYSSDFLFTSTGFDYYFTKWVLSGRNLRFQIANKYSKCITNECDNDAVINTTTLPQDANIRFMWNSHTNTFSRAYMSGSTNVSDRFLVLEGQSATLLNEDGEALNVSGLNTNEQKFTDQNNWVYETRVQAVPGARIKLTAKYNDNTQYFLGSASEYYTLIGGSGGSAQPLRIIYDFKTNRLISAWEATEATISENLDLQSDVMVRQQNQGDAPSITFASGKQLSGVRTVYGVLEMEKTFLTNPAKTRYERDLYWISFPFDVRLKDVFGFGTYGTHWILEYYDGEGRAKNGYWADSEPNWKFVWPEDRQDFVLKAFQGYIVALDLDEVNASGSPIWRNSVTTSAIYFPSAENIGTISANLINGGSIEVPQHICTIQRDKRYIKDSNWNVIGIPSFANVVQTLSDCTQDEVNLKFAYTPTLNAANEMQAVATGSMDFHPMKAYLVQYGGTLNWSAPMAPSVAAPQRQTEEQTIRLQLLKDGEEADRTFFCLSENATDGFDLNADMSKIFRQGVNIYSFAENVELAGNCMPMETDTLTIPLGVKISEAGTYVLNLEGCSCVSAYIVDSQAGTTSSLTMQPFEINLPAGDHNQRFFLKLIRAAMVPTPLENAQTKSSAIKLIENGRLVILSGQRKYAANGMLLKD